MGTILPAFFQSLFVLQVSANEYHPHSVNTGFVGFLCVLEG
jgi:hypothetical protein